MRIILLLISAKVSSQNFVNKDSVFVLISNAQDNDLFIFK